MAKAKVNIFGLWSALSLLMKHLRLSQHREQNSELEKPEQHWHHEPSVLTLSQQPLPGLQAQVD